MYIEIQIQDSMMAKIEQIFGFAIFLYPSFDTGSGFRDSKKNPWDSNNGSKKALGRKIGLFFTLI